MVLARAIVLCIVHALHVTVTPKDLSGLSQALSVNPVVEDYKKSLYLYNDKTIEHVVNQAYIDHVLSFARPAKYRLYYQDNGSMDSVVITGYEEARKRFLGAVEYAAAHPEAELPRLEPLDPWR